MPNHITNELIAAPHVIDSLADKEAVDFNTVIPMPNMLVGEPDCEVLLWAEIASGALNMAEIEATLGGDAAAAFSRGDYGAATKVMHASNAVRSMRAGPFPKDFDDQRFEQFITAVRCLRTHGCASWYEWCIEHWGTKWNAYEIKRIDEAHIRFETAWSCPLPIVEALSRKFPTNPVRVRWADEDHGNNAGDVTYQAGEVVSGGRVANGSREAHALALDLVFGGELPEEMRITEAGKLEYVEA